MQEDPKAPIGDSRFDNPFVKDRLKAGVLTKYRSDSSCRIVWTSENASEVAPEGERRCDLWKFDTVVFVWMDARRLPIELSRQFISANSLPLNVTIELIAQPKDDDDSLRSIALHFAEKRAVIATCASAFLHERCKALTLTNAKTEDEDLAPELRNHLEAETGNLGLPLVFLRATVKVDCPSLESVLTERTVADIKHKLVEEQEARAHDIQLIKARNYLALLSEQTASIALEQKKLLDTAKTQEAIEKGKIEMVLPLKDMSPEMLIVAMRGNPEIGKQLAELAMARNTNPAVVIELTKAIVEATKDLRVPGAGMNMFTVK